MDRATFVRRVEENSLSLQGARTDRELAEVQERLARSQLYPSIGGQIGYNRNLLELEQEIPVGVAATGEPGFYPLAAKAL